MEPVSLNKYPTIKVGAYGGQVINGVLGPILLAGPVGPQIHPWDLKMSSDAKCINEMDILGR